MEIEQEYRYLITDQIGAKISKVATEVDTKRNQIDLTLGYDGFYSLEKYGYVCRVR